MNREKKICILTLEDSILVFHSGSSFKGLCRANEAVSIVLFWSFGSFSRKGFWAVARDCSLSLLLWPIPHWNRTVGMSKFGGEAFLVDVFCYLIGAVSMYLPKFVGDQYPRPCTFRRPCEEKMVPGHSFTSSKNSVKKLKQTRLLHALIVMHSESFNEFVILKLDCLYVIFLSH